MKVCLTLTFYFLILSVSNNSLFSQVSKEPLISARLSGGPVLSVYKNNKYHTSGTRPKSAFKASLLLEFKLYKELGIALGASYFYHGLTFNSYYRASGYDYLYDGEYKYTYEMRLKELRIPVLFRYHPQKEYNRRISPYAAIGMSYCHLFKRNNLDVSSIQNGQYVFSGISSIKFDRAGKTSLNGIGLVCLTGLQHNIHHGSTALFAEIGLDYCVSNYYLNDPFVASNLKLRGMLFSVSFGLKL